MKLVVQRVKEADVKVEGRQVGVIKAGLLIYLGVDKDDELTDVDYLVNKIINLRIFEDAQGKMNLALSETKADVLVVSQFTLLGDCAKGRRPSFDQAAEPKKGEEYYNLFVTQLKQQGFNVQTGQFRAMMDVYSINDGPVTFILESRPC